jgi:4-hydroxybenzoate polyprenyltransferase
MSAGAAARPIAAWGRGRVLALLEISRPATSLTAPLLAALGVRLAVADGSVDGAAWGLPRLVGLAVGWFLLAQAVFAINDYFDAPIDAVCHPARPIPSGRIAGEDALRLGSVLGLAGIAVLTLVAAPLGMVAVLYAAASWAYSAWLKNRHGLAANAVVAGLVALVPARSGPSGRPALVSPG